MRHSVIQALTAEPSMDYHWNECAKPLGNIAETAEIYKDEGHAHGGGGTD